MIAFIKRWITKEIMEDLGVGEAAKEQFQQELDSGNARRIGDIVITENWLACKAGVVPAERNRVFQKGVFP